MRSIFSAIVVFALLFVLTGVIYPLAVTGIAHFVFPYQANGSMVHYKDKIIGSRLIGQQFQENKYFWSRPSASNYDGVKSGGTNLAPTSKELQRIAQERRERLAIAHKSDLKSVPANLIFSSGSGLDPHITVEAAEYQIDRVAAARGITHVDGIEAIKKTVAETVQIRTAKYMGSVRVNVLLLNRKLDELTEKMANG